MSLDGVTQRALAFDDDALRDGYDVETAEWVEGDAVGLEEVR